MTTTRKAAFAIALILVARGALSQAPVAQPKLSASTGIAVKALQQRAQQINQFVVDLNQDAAAIDADIKSQAPGYHLDGKTLQVVKDEPVSAPAAASAPVPPSPTSPASTKIVKK